MNNIKIVKTNIVGGLVDDVVKTYKELKAKIQWLDGCVYINNMLVYVEDKKAVYQIKVVC